MRPVHYTLSPTLVCRQAVALLVTHLALPAFRTRVPAALLARLLLWATATRRSLSALCRRSTHAPSDETVRQALLVALPPTEQELQRRLLAGLHALVPRAARRRALPMALDLHLRPYYGTPRTPGVVGGQRKDGTRYFWAYATLVVLVQGLRVTVGLTAVARGQPLTALLETLLEQARQAGVRPAWLLLDRGFYAADVVQWLQQRQVAFVMPMIRRGRADRGTGTQPFFARSRATGWATYTWTARPRRWDAVAGKKRKGPALTVTADVCVVARPGQRPWVYLGHGVRWSPDLVRKRYRLRFGIETSYRQLHACLALTTSRDRRVRLLLIGLALFLRQWWVWLHYEVLAERRPHGRRRWHLERLRLEDVKLWVHTAMAQALGYVLEIETQQPMPLVA